MEDDEIGVLLRAAQGGGADAMDDLLAHLRPLVLSRCSRFLPFRDDAEEAAQDALLAISRHLGDFTGSGSFLGWVTVIASNSARSTYRSLRRRAETSSETLPESPDPRTTSVIAGTRLDLMEALQGLEERHPALVESFVLRDLGALPYAEVAALTGAPLGTVKARIHEARAYMRDRLGPAREPR